MPILLYGLLGALAVAGVGQAAYAGIQRRAERTKNPPPSEHQRRVAEVGQLGFRNFLAREFSIYDAAAGAIRGLIERLRGVEARVSERWERLGKPVIGAHEHFVAYVVGVAVMALIAVFLFVVNRELEVGVIKTLDIAEDQADAIGTIIAVWVALIGIVLVELALPSGMFPGLRDMPRPRRLIWAGTAGAVLVATLLPLPNLAATRADTRLGVGVDRDQAACEDAQADPEAEIAEVSVACAEAGRSEKKLERARQWDQMVAVAAPVGEVVASWGLLRLLELFVAAGLGFSLRRATSRREDAEAELEQDEREFVAAITEIGIDAGIEPDEIRRLLAGDPPDDDPSPTPPSALQPSEADGTTDDDTPPDPVGVPSHNLSPPDEGTGGAEVLDEDCEVPESFAQEGTERANPHEVL